MTEPLVVSTTPPSLGPASKPTLGVEEEYLIVDEQTLELAPVARELLSAVDVDRSDVEAEAELMSCMIEVSTDICHSATEVLDDLTMHRRTLEDVAAKSGVALVGLGTHPFSSWKDQSVTGGSRRFSELLESYRLIAREQVICGFHVHVGIPDPDVVVSTMTRMRPWLAPILALSANSPMWEGQDSGYQSYRSVLWQRWPTAHMPPSLDDAEQYQDIVNQLAESGAVPDATHLYWYARPSVRHPTLEIRIGDVATTAKGTTALAALVRALVWRCLEEPSHADCFETKAPNEVLEAAIWRASRYGLNDTLVSPSTLVEAPARAVITEMLEMARPMLIASGELDLVEQFILDTFQYGSGAQWQRTTAAEPYWEPRRIVDAARRCFSGDSA